MENKGIYIDPILLAGISAFFVMIVIPGCGWLFKQLWTDRNDAYKENVNLLKAQFADADARKTLWAEQAAVIKDQGATIRDQVREISALKQQWVDFLNEYRRKNP